MAVQGPNSPSIAVSTSVPVGEFDWANTGNVFVSDGIFSTATAPRDDVICNALDITGFGFSIPEGSVINGITVRIQKAGSSLDVTDWVIKLLDNNAEVGDNKMDFGNSWPTTEVYHTYGSDSDDWGYAWTAAKINGTGFSVRIEAHVAIEGESAKIDYADIAVDYTPAVVVPPAGGFRGLLDFTGLPYGYPAVGGAHAGSSQQVGGRRHVQYILRQMQDRSILDRVAVQKLEELKARVIKHRLEFEMERRRSEKLFINAVHAVILAEV